MVRNILLLSALSALLAPEVRARAITVDDLISRSSLSGRTRITVLPRAEEVPPPEAPIVFLVTPGTDLWFTKGRERPEPGASLAWDGFLTPGPLRLSVFLEGGAIFRRESWTEERPYTREISGEPYTFLSIVRVERESLVPAWLFGMALSFEGGLKGRGFWTCSAGFGGAWTDSSWAVALRGALSIGWREGPFSAGVRLGADGRWNEGFMARLSLGLTGGMAF